MTEWKEYKLGELLGKKGYIRGPFGSALKRPEMKSEGFAVYEQQHAIYNTREFRYFIDDIKFSELKRFSVLPNDLIISCSGTVGQVSIINDVDPKGIISQALLTLRPNLELVSPKFLYYFFKTRNGYNQLLSASHGSVQVNIAKREVVESIPISVPNIETQNNIAEILSSLDDKIELNNQINKDLEALAQALFKQWFIDFEFPNENGEPYRSSGGEMVESELGEIPKGWSATNYGAITKKENLKVKKSKKNITKVYSAIKTSELVLSEDYFTKQVFSKSLENYYVVENLWFAYNPSRINIGSIGLNKNEAGAVSPVYIVFSAVDNMHFYIENHLKLESIKSEIIQKCSGTVRQALNYDSLSTFPVVKPPKSLIDKFNQFWVENTNSISQIKSETEYLIGLRDTLLPKLISGELEVSDIQTKTL